VKLERRCLDDTTGDGQLSAKAGEERVNVASTLATFVDAPDDKRLSTATVTSGEDTREVGVVLAWRSLDVLAWIKLNYVVHDALLRAQETHGEEDEVSREKLLTALDVLHIPTARGGLGPLNTNGVDSLDVAVAVIDEVLRHNAVLARVFAHVGLDFVVTVVRAEDTGPLWPWVVTSTLWWGLRQKLEVDD
jgi:hypothetical protein